MKEYRLVWQREGCRRRVKRYATLKGAERFALILQGRMAEATGLDPESFICCARPACYCGMNQTMAKEWTRVAERVPPLIIGPVLEEREIGEWQGRNEMNERSEQ